MGFPLLPNKAWKWGQEAWIWGSYELHSFEEKPVQSGQVGFPLLPNKALAGVKKHGLDVCTRWTLWGHVRSGQRGFLLLLNKALPGVKNHKALKCGQEAWIWGFYNLHSFEEGLVQSGQVGFPLLLNKALAGVLAQKIVDAQNVQFAHAKGCICVPGVSCAGTQKTPFAYARMG